VLGIPVQRHTRVYHRGYLVKLVETRIYGWKKSRIRGDRGPGGNNLPKPRAKQVRVKIGLEVIAIPGGAL